MDIGEESGLGTPGGGFGSNDEIPFEYLLILKDEDHDTAEDGTKNYFAAQRHTGRNQLAKKKPAKWRMKGRLKTVHVALVLCLNIGVDPPDVFKVQPCAKLECWIDPLSLPQLPKALETIGNHLKLQYERWQPRARYKQCLDPTVEDVKKTCQQLRRSAKQDERVLFHYNGHGVPRPTANGEIWVFNKDFTQYIPLSIYDLHMWMGSPSIYVFDCSSAGLIVNTFIQIVEQREKEIERANPGTLGPIKRETIILAACAANETLPQNPEYPADLFTSCLTTPIKIALEWFCQHNRLIKGISKDLIKNIPGRINDRRTPLGELNWIFTAITDTIAWNVLPRDLFQKLFRQDLLVASLFRNFLLAERIMRMANCTPVSYPHLPATHNHPMWHSWDLAVDMCLSQLPTLISNPTAEFKYSTFFAEQLTAFEVWLNFGSEQKRPPEQLPIVLQVLLSQAHRLRALTLLGRFLDLGPWAVNLALSVGIFPYVLKLLQSHAADLRQILVFIWAKILALDKSCQADLVKDNGHVYFKNVLSMKGVDAQQKTMACFILSVIVDNYLLGQTACLNHGIFKICIEQLKDPNPLLRRWALLCIAKLLEGYDDAKIRAFQEEGHLEIIKLLTDDVPEVRAAAVFCLQQFVISGDAQKSEEIVQIELDVGSSLFQVISDGSPLVRKELVYSLFTFIKAYEEHISPALLKGIIEEERSARQVEPPSPEQKKPPKSKKSKEAKEKQQLNYEALSSPSSPFGEYLDANNNSGVLPGGDPTDIKNRTLGTQSFFALDLCRVILLLCGDPMPEVADCAQRCLDYLTRTLLEPTPPASPSPMSQHKSAPKSPFPKKSPAESPAPQSKSELIKTGLFRRTSLPNLEEIGNQAQLAAAAQPPTPTELTLPQSNFYEWSAQYFSNPLLVGTAAEDDNNGSVVAAQRRWRKKRNEKIIRETALLYRNAGTRKLEDQIGILGNDTEYVSTMRFHPFEPLLFVADENDGISVWNWEQGVRNNTFYCGRRLNGRITSIDLINEHDNTLLLIASSTGNIMVYKDTYQLNAQSLVTSFRAAPEAVSTGQGPGIITEWQQDNGLLYVSGEIGTVKIWDVERELCAQSIETQTDTCVSSLTSDKTGGGHMLVAGCGDGSIRIFDRRMPGEHSLVAVLKEHQNWIVDVSMQKTTNAQFISGSVSGDIKFWDVRMDASTRTIEAHRSAMTALAVHDYAPILASGSNNQFIKVFNTSGDTLSMIYYHDGFLGARIGPVSCLAFHPYRLCLAAGATDSIISIYSGEKH